MIVNFQLHSEISDLHKIQCHSDFSICYSWHSNIASSFQDQGEALLNGLLQNLLTSAIFYLRCLFY